MVIFIATLLPRLLRIGFMPAIQRILIDARLASAGYGQLAYYRGLEQEGLLRSITDAKA
ncbi:MAG: hypothetical protein U0744_07760 [Gemmataceae bacterium]